MKLYTFGELTAKEQAKALGTETNSLLTAITEGAIRFSDTNDDDGLQTRIDAAFEKAESMRTPWFAHEYIMDTCGDDIRGMAQSSAEDALYHTGTERIVLLS